MARSANPPDLKFLRHEDLVDGEELRAETRATKLRYFPGPLMALLLIGFLDYGAAASVYTWLPSLPVLTPMLGGITVAGATFILYFFLLLTVGVLILILARYLEWIRTVYAVTSSRIIIRKGILSRDLEEIPISQVRGIEVHQSFAHRILGYGTIRVSSEAGSTVGNEDWFGIPDPFNFQRVIETASQRISRGQSPPMAAPVSLPPVRPVG